MPSFDTTLGNIIRKYEPTAEGFAGFSLKKLMAIDPLHTRSYWIGLPVWVLLGFLAIFALTRNACMVWQDFGAGGVRRNAVRWVVRDTKRAKSRSKATTAELMFPPEAWEQIKTCTHAFMLAYLTLEWYDSNNKWFGHANILLFDYGSKLVSRFEPLGEASPKEFRPEQFDTTFGQALQGQLPGWHYLSGGDVCRGSGVQTIQSRERVHIPNEPKGFCAAWTLYFIHMKLLHPTLSHRQLDNMAANFLSLRIADRQLPNFTAFIAAYARAIQDTGMELLNAVEFSLTRSLESPVEEIAEVLERNLLTLIAYVGRKKGVHVFPGEAQLEAVRGAFRAIGKDLGGHYLEDGPVELHELRWYFEEEEKLHGGYVQGTLHYEHFPTRWLSARKAITSADGKVWAKVTTTCSDDSVDIEVNHLFLRAKRVNRGQAAELGAEIQP